MRKESNLLCALLLTALIPHSATTAIRYNGEIVGAGTKPDVGQRAILLTPATPGDSEPDRDVDLRDFAVFAAAWRPHLPTKTGIHSAIFQNRKMVQSIKAILRYLLTTILCQHHNWYNRRLKN